MLRVLGLAYSQPFNRKDPTEPQNRRISIIVMNRDAEDRFYRPTADLVEPASAKNATGQDADPSIRPEKPAVVSSTARTGR